MVVGGTEQADELSKPTSVRIPESRVGDLIEVRMIGFNWHLCIFMAALRSRCRHYIFVLWFLLSSSTFLFSRLISAVGRRLDVYHTFTHGVALVRI